MVYKINFGDDFDQRAWELESKGWFDVNVSVDGMLVSLSFYDPARLAQEVESSLSTKSVFFERNIVVIPVVNRTNIEGAVEALNISGSLRESVG